MSWSRKLFVSDERLTFHLSTMASYCSRLKSIVGLINPVKVLDILIDLSFIAMLGVILTVSLVQPGSRLSQVRISLAGATLAVAGSLLSECAHYSFY